MKLDLRPSGLGAGALEGRPQQQEGSCQVEIRAQFWAGVSKHTGLKREQAGNAKF